MVEKKTFTNAFPPPTELVADPKPAENRAPSITKASGRIRVGFGDNRTLSDPLRIAGQRGWGKGKMERLRLPDQRVQQLCVFSSAHHHFHFYLSIFLPATHTSIHTYIQSMPTIDVEVGAKVLVLSLVFLASLLVLTGHPLSFSFSGLCYMCAVVQFSGFAQNFTPSGHRCCCSTCNSPVTAQNRLPT